MFKKLFLIVLLVSNAYAQQALKVDFKSVEANLEVHFEDKSVRGHLRYEFEIFNVADTIKIDAVNMVFKNVQINNQTTAFLYNGKKLQLTSGFKKGMNYLTFDYTAFPKQALYFVGTTADFQIWTQGQGRYTSNWFPSFDDPNEKVVFNINLLFDKAYQVISNGVLTKKTSKPSDKFEWHYTMDKPMSSYLLMLAIGKFESKTETSLSGVPLQLFIEPQEVNKIESTYKYSTSIFDFMEAEIGVGYPWKIYKQVPARDFLYAGMENTSATLFSHDFVVDAIGFNDRNYINVNAHELAHQWFGDLVTAKSGKDHWLQEGFATFYALLAEQKFFGDDYFYWKMYEMAEQLQRAKATDVEPILSTKASSLTYYQKGAWALFVLRDGLGEATFKKVVQHYLNNYAYQNVTTADFLNEVNQFSNFDTQSFKKRWLESSDFEVKEALALLSKHDVIQNYFKIAELKEVSFEQKQKNYETILASTAFYPLKIEVLNQLQEVPFVQKKELLQLALKDPATPIHQAIASSVLEFPNEFRPTYESFLNDASYTTREIALSVLWKKYPDDQIKLLNDTKDWKGNNDHNLEILWLTLALQTKGYNLANKTNYYDRLLAFASPNYDSSIRQNALNNLIYLDQNDQNYLPYLVNALTHYKWQFSKFAREKIREYLKGKSHRNYFEKLVPNLPEKEQLLLQKLIDEPVKEVKK